MKNTFLIAVLFLFQSINAQQQNFFTHSIKLPQELAEPENQFSGLQIADGKLYLLPECRIQEKHAARLYTISIADIEKQLIDSTYTLPFKKITIHGLDKVAVLISQQGQLFEGLEAFLISNKNIYFSVEPTTESFFCYLLKGKLKKGAIYLDKKVTAVKKPTMKNGSLIYNASFEAISFINKKIAAFYEYNYFENNFAYSFNKRIQAKSEDLLPLQALPFRITDITPIGNNHFTAINFFYKGADANTVYRVTPSDSVAYLHTNTNGVFKDYCSLVNIEYRNQQFYWKTIWEFPKNYTGYNWEGIAAYKGGYFIVNDKYTLSKPYSSVLLYLKPQ